MAVISRPQALPIQANGARHVALVAIVVLGCTQGRDPLAKALDTRSPGCIALDTAAQVDSSAVTQDVRKGRRYRCVLGAGGSPMVAVLVGDTAANIVDSVVLQREHGAPIQTLHEGMEEPPYRGADLLRAVDFDGDGRLDLALLTSWGATGNTLWNVWRQDATGRFAFDSTLSALASPKAVPGRPCVASTSVGGAAGMIYDSVTVCREGGRWVETVVVASRADSQAGVFLRSVRERRGDSLVLTRTDTVRDTLR